MERKEDAHTKVLTILAWAITGIVTFSFALHVAQVTLDFRQPVVKCEFPAASRNEKLTFLKILILKPSVPYDLAREIAGIVEESARDFDRDADFILSIIYVESHFDPTAVSRVGAVGLMQVMPVWLKVMGVQKEDLLNPRVNIRRGLQLYGSYERLFGEDRVLALTAYNRGSWKVEEDLRNSRDPRNGYAKEVLEVYERLKDLQ